MGGENSTRSSPRKEAAYSAEKLRAWSVFHRDRPYAAVASGKLRFREVNLLLGDKPPSIVRENDMMRVYLFLSGEHRDMFVEAFHRRFRARAFVIGNDHAS